MYIQPISNNISMYGSMPPNKPNSWKAIKNRIKQKALDLLPNATFNDSGKKVDTWNRISDKISRPVENRLIMGGTALITQPAIDRYNHKVDEETRIVSRNRTLAKIIAGVIVGICVRGSCYKLVENMTKIDGTGKYSKKLLPEDFMESFKKFLKKLKAYQSTVSTLMAILAMSITNFAIDAPLTAYLTNKFNANCKKLQKKEVNNG